MSEAVEKACAGPAIPTGAIQHVGILVKDVEKARDFYAKLLAPIGYKIFAEHLPVAVGFTHEAAGPAFWIHTDDGKGVGAGTHVAFYSQSKELIEKWHANAIEIGATDNGAPGPRHYSPTYWAAFVKDEDGNNIEVLTL